MTRTELSKALDVIDIDFNANDIPPSVKDLQPLVYRDGDNICVMEGETPMDGIFGCGINLSAAMQDFQMHYEQQKENSV